MHNCFADGLIHQIVDDYSDMVIRIALQYVRSRPDAEDIMQEVFLSLLGRPAFADGQHLKAWLIRVTINKSKNHLKKLKRRRETALDLADNHLTHEQAEMLEELSLLPEDDRNIIYLYYYEGYSASEIGGIIGKKQKAVLMRLSRARAKLRHLLEERQEY